MDFLTPNKIFVLDNLNIVLDKKYFVRADGQGISDVQGSGWMFGKWESKKTL